jgi:hypothetical protein
MKAALSQRCGRAFHHAPASLLTLNERVEFEDRNDGARRLSDLSADDRKLVHDSERGT